MDMSKKGDLIKKFIFGKWKIVISILVVLIIALCCLLIFNKGARVKIKVKSSLEKVVEKSNLETVNVRYNIVAKECKKEDKCDKSSNNINDFKYVVSCTGTVTAGIDFKNVLIDVDASNKKIFITIPDASVTGEPSITDVKLLNGASLPASATADAMKLCLETTKEKSVVDGNLNSVAKEQAKIVLEQYYSQWIKAYDSSYVVEVK